jgi:four helix bundle protein
MLDLAHKKLDVYKIALQLLHEVYAFTKKWPKQEQFTLTSQVRRAAISICSNIAEGSARFSKLEKKRFYEIARSSAVEVDTQFEIALMIGYSIGDEMKTAEQLLESVFRMLNRMISNLRVS